MKNSKVTDYKEYAVHLGFIAFKEKQIIKTVGMINTVRK